LHAAEEKPYERETIVDQNQLLDALRVNLEVIYCCLDEAAREVDKALTAIEQGNQNGAIEAILKVPERLEDIKSFYDGVMRLQAFRQATLARNSTSPNSKKGLFSRE